MAEIEHCPREEKFYLRISEGEGLIKYKKLSNKWWDFYFTFVPKVADKDTIKEKMISHALNFVRLNNIKIRATCISVQNFLLKNKQFKEIIYFPY